MKPEAQRASNEAVQADNANSVFASGCTSWYKTESGKVTNNWANYTFKYWWMTRRPNFAEFNLRARTASAQGAAAGGMQVAAAE